LAISFFLPAGGAGVDENRQELVRVHDAQHAGEQGLLETRHPDAARVVDQFGEAILDLARAVEQMAHGVPSAVSCGRRAMSFHADLNPDMLPGAAPTRLLAKSLSSCGSQASSPSGLNTCWYFAQYGATSASGAGF
jgi:hypothetical protein